ncbi:hypothetical protein HOY80DRAFT_1006556 [Tuber brumale]|nr:hypothetical protein HOY80DRAFT_1006556 [Tuber brumale]
MQQKAHNSTIPESNSNLISQINKTQNGTFTLSQVSKLLEDDEAVEYSTNFNISDWRSQSYTSNSELEDLPTGKNQEHHSLTPEIGEHQVYQSQQSHWPKVLGLEQMLGDLEIGKEVEQEVVEKNQVEIENTREEWEEGISKAQRSHGQEANEPKFIRLQKFNNGYQMNWQEDLSSKENENSGEAENIEDENSWILPTDFDDELESIYPNPEDEDQDYLESISFPSSSIYNWLSGESSSTPQGLQLSSVLVL